jgi:signal peptidase II
MTYQGDMPGQEAAPRKPIYKDLLLLQLAALVFLLDQFSKFLVREFLTFREAYPVEGFFRIIHSRNTGSAFGIFRDQNGPLILVSLVGMTALALIYYRYRGSTNSTNLLRLSLGLQMGGAAGNLLDRVLLGHVIDFIDVGKWPVFNLADSSIVLGLVLLAWLFLGPERLRMAGPSAEAVVGADQAGVYARCPICDGEMLAAGHGWHCSGCGVMERIDAGHGSPEPPVVVEQPAAARGNGPKPMGPTEAIQTSSVPPAEAPSSCELADGYMPEVAAGEATPPYRGDELGSSGTSRPL